MRVKWTAMGALAAAAIGAGAALARRRPAPALPSPGASPTPTPSVTGDPAAALDEARDRLRRRAADLRAEMEGEGPPP